MPLLNDEHGARMQFAETRLSVVEQFQILARGEEHAQSSRQEMLALPPVTIQSVTAPVAMGGALGRAVLQSVTK